MLTKSELEMPERVAALFRWVKAGGVEGDQRWAEKRHIVRAWANRRAWELTPPKRQADAAWQQDTASLDFIAVLAQLGRDGDGHRLAGGGPLLDHRARQRQLNEEVHGYIQSRLDVAAPLWSPPFTSAWRRNQLLSMEHLAEGRNRTLPLFNGGVEYDSIRIPGSTRPLRRNQIRPGKKERSYQLDDVVQQGWLGVYAKGIPTYDIQRGSAFAHLLSAARDAMKFLLRPGRPARLSTGETNLPTGELHHAKRQAALEGELLEVYEQTPEPDADAESEGDYDTAPRYSPPALTRRGMAFRAWLTRAAQELPEMEKAVFLMRHLVDGEAVREVHGLRKRSSPRLRQAEVVAALGGAQTTVARYEARALARLRAEALAEGWAKELEAFLARDRQADRPRSDEDQAARALRLDEKVLKGGGDVAVGLGRAAVLPRYEGPEAGPVVRGQG